MSVVKCRLIGDRRSGQLGAIYVNTYKQIFRVETDSALDGPAVVMAPHGLTGNGNVELPIRYVDTYSSGNDSDDDAICVSLDAIEEQGTGFKSWIVTADFSTMPPTNPEQLDQNPLDEPPRYSLAFSQYTTVARRALIAQPDGTLYGTTPVPLRNSLGEIFRPGIEVDDSRPIYTIQRNEAFVYPGVVMQFVNTVNATAWNGCPPRTVKCQSISSGQVQQRNQFTYYAVTYEFHLNPATWDLIVLNQAAQWEVVLDANGANPKLTKILTGGPVTIYNGEGSNPNGKRLADDTAVPQTAVNPDEIYMRYRYYNEVDFNILGF